MVPSMDLRIFIEPQQGTSYGAVLGLASTAERLGFNGFFSSDHYLVMGDSDGLPGPLDAWTTLAGLARDTERLRLGTLVTPITFRRPGPLAIAVAQVDDMSGGRIELGLGTGWYDAEHAATGVPFGTVGERFDTLEEQLEILTGWWTTPVGGTFSHDGTHFRITESPALPKPTQRPHPPIIIGGGGPRRTPRLAAKFASEFNLPFSSVDDTAAQYERVRAACADRGRDPDDLVYSAGVVLCCGATEGDLARRAAAIGRDPAELRENGAAGLPDEVAATIRSYADIGASRVYLQVLDIDDTEHLDLVASEVVPAVN